MEQRERKEVALVNLVITILMTDESCKALQNSLVFINTEPVTDERRNRARNSKPAAFGGMKQAEHLQLGTRKVSPCVAPLIFSTGTSTQRSSPALLINLPTSLWFYPNFRHQITFEVSAPEVNLPESGQRVQRLG